VFVWSGRRDSNPAHRSGRDVGIFIQRPVARAGSLGARTRTKTRPAKLKLFSSRWLVAFPYGFESRRPRQSTSTLAARRMGFEPVSAVFSVTSGPRLRFSSMDVRGRGLTARTRPTTRPACLASGPRQKADRSLNSARGGGARRRGPSRLRVRFHPLQPPPQIARATPCKRAPRFMCAALERAAKSSRAPRLLVDRFVGPG
jgi:hypothetical protein